MKKILEAVKHLFRRKRWPFGAKGCRKLVAGKASTPGAVMSDDEFKDKMDRIFHIEATKDGVHLKSNLYVDGYNSALGEC